MPTVLRRAPALTMAAAGDARLAEYAAQHGLHDVVTGGMEVVHAGRTAEGCWEVVARHRPAAGCRRRQRQRREGGDAGRCGDGANAGVSGDWDSFGDDADAGGAEAGAEADASGASGASSDEDDDEGGDGDGDGRGDGNTLHQLRCDFVICCAAVVRRPLMPPPEVSTSTPQWPETWRTTWAAAARLSGLVRLHTTEGREGRALGAWGLHSQIWIQRSVVLLLHRCTAAGRGRWLKSAVPHPAQAGEGGRGSAASPAWYAPHTCPAL